MQKDLLTAFGGLLSANLLSTIGKRQGEIISKKVQTEAGSFDYQVYLPHGIEKKNDLPVIVFLHGIRERGSGGFVPTEGALGKFLRQYLKQVPAIVLLPQCRPGKYWSDPAMDKMVMQALAQTIEEFKADSQRISLIGVSMGGYGVWHFAAQYPEKFAALVSICGGSSIMNGDRFTPIAEKMGRTPAWLFHGAEDSIVPVTESRSLVKAIEAHHGNVKYSEFPGVGHNVWLNALGDSSLLPWILDQHLE